MSRLGSVAGDWCIRRCTRRWACILPCAADGPFFAFALAGGIACVNILAPPIRWAYRGLGELVIALSYGPWMVLGSVYLYTRAVSWGALIASLVPGLLIMALAVVNAIPDFPPKKKKNAAAGGDRLVGKPQPRCQARPRARGAAVRGPCRGRARCGAHRRRLRHVSPGNPRGAPCCPAFGVERAQRHPHLRNTPAVCAGESAALFAAILPRCCCSSAQFCCRPRRCQDERPNQPFLQRGPLLISWRRSRACGLSSPVCTGCTGLGTG